MKLRLLLVEDSPDDELLLVRQLRQDGFEVEHLRVESAAALDQALEQPWDLVVSDYNLPGFDGLKALARVKAKLPDLPFVIVSGTVGEDTAVEAMKGGATDYVMKGNLKRLPAAIRRLVAEARLKAERRSLEEQVRQSQKMELVGQLAGAVAHDFNNLLTVILNFSQFAHDDLPERHKSREDLKEVIECAKRAAQLTRQLLTFSRKSVSEPAMIELNGLLQSSDRMLRRLLGPRIDYATLSDADQVWVKADRGQLEQVVVNLVVNARDAMPEGGKLTVEVTPMPAEGQHPSPRVMLAVTDTGCGMTEAVQRRVFEPFFSTKPPGTGTGLGLSTTLGIVKQYGGEIAVYSAPGRGTTFKVYLPMAAADETPTVQLPRAPSRGGTETVLVVEDQETVREAMVRTLSAHGYRVLEAARPKDALLIVEGHTEPLHLVLSDLVLPEMSGAELVERLRQKRPNLVVLFTSGFAGGALGHQGVVAAGMGFLQKPFTAEALTDKVRAALDAPAWSTR